MIDCFIKRGILRRGGPQAADRAGAVFKRPALDVFHSVEFDRRPRAAGPTAFSIDNRAKLFISLSADIDVPEIVRANKRTRDGLPMPQQTIVAISLARGACARRQEVWPLRRRKHLDALRRHHGARPERQT
jgi:hypothetical protein